jgi:hypothetical protein
MKALGALVFSFLLLLGASAEKWNHMINGDKAIEIAEWSMSKLSKLTKVNDDHRLIDIYEISSQAVSGINYKLVLDVSIGYGNDTKVKADAYFFFHVCMLTNSFLKLDCSVYNLCV